MRTARSIQAITLSVLLCAGAARAAEKLPEEVPDIVIEAPKVDLAHRAVAIFAQPPFREQMARWAEPLRVQVYYAPKPAADFLTQRLTEVAATVGLKVKPAHNDANVAIVFTGQSSQFVRRLLKAHAGLYRDIDRTGFPAKAEVALLLQDRPVRWFEVRRDTVWGAASDLSRSPISRSTGFATRLEEQTAFRKDLSYVIVDSDLVHGVSWQQLADYLAMVVLTEPGLDYATAPRESILSIFSPNHPDKPAGMTPLDQAVLTGFYQYDESQRGVVQRAEIERSVARAISTPPAATPK